MVETRNRWRGCVRRYLSAALFNLSCFSHGCATGWVSGALGARALTGGAWLAALPCLAALPAAPALAALADARGRKGAALIVSFAFVVSWCLTGAGGARALGAARAAAGAGGAGALALGPLYSAEIAPGERRGALASIPVLFCSFGVLSAYVTAPLLAPQTLALMMATPSLVLMVSLIWLPETPAYLISKGRIQDAAKVMCWLNGSDFRKDLTDVIEEQEVKIRTHGSFPLFRSSCTEDEDTRTGELDTFEPMIRDESFGMGTHEKDISGTKALKSLFQKNSLRRALFIGFALLTVQAGCGVGAVSSYAAAVLDAARSPLAPPGPAAPPGYTAPSAAGTPLGDTARQEAAQNVARAPPSPPAAGKPQGDTARREAVLYGVALVAGATTAAVSMDRFGRKVLLICSCVGIAKCLVLLGLYCDPRLKVRELLGQDLIWLPVALLSGSVFLYNIGIGTVPFVVIGEFFAVEVRSLASSVLISWMWLSFYFLLRYFNTVIERVGLSTTCYICACISVLGAVFTWLVVPETRLKSVERILADLDESVFPFRTVSRNTKVNKMSVEIQ